MKSTNFLKQVILKNKTRLGITYLLFTLEMAGALLKPFFLGEAINDLLNGGYTGLIYFLSLHLAWLIIGMLRMRYDTRTYTQIYNSIITQFLARQKKEKNVSKLSAISTLSREFTDFLEWDLVYVLEALYNVFGSLVLIYFYDKRVILICFAIMIPIMFISRKYGKTMGILTQKKNDELEKQVEIISTFDTKKIETHYESLRKWNVKISDQQSFNFGIMETFVLILLAGSLIISTKYNAEVLNAGEIIGFYFYLLKFTEGLDTIPYFTEKYASLKDIGGRLQEQVGE